MKLSATPCPTPAAHQGGQQPRDLGESLEGFPVVLDQLLVVLDHPLQDFGIDFLAHGIYGSTVTVMRLE